MSSQERSREQKMAHVRAGDEEDKENDSRGDAERRGNAARAVEWRFPEGKNLDAMAAICFGKIVLQSFRDRGKFRLSLLPRDARFEKRVTFNPARAAVLEFVTGIIKRLLHRRRDPEVERVTNEGAVEFF